MSMLLENFLEGDKFLSVVSNIGAEKTHNGGVIPALADEAIMKNLLQLSLLRLVTMVC